MSEALDAVPDDYLSWMKEFIVGDQTAVLAKWGAVIKVIEGLRPVHVEGLIRISSGTRQKADEATLKMLIDAFHAADDSFTPNSNRELQVLTACVAAVAAKQNGAIRLPLVLALCTSWAAGARIPLTPVPIFEIARTSKNELGTASLLRAQITAKIEVPPISSAAAAQKLTPQVDVTTVTAALEVSAGSVNAVLAQILGKVNITLQEMARRLNQQDDELNMLWWVFGGCSEETQCSHQDVPEATRPFIFGKELASLTSLPPGPTSITSLFSRVGISVEARLSVVSAIDQCTAAWAESTTGSRDYSPVTFPLHFALTRMLETGTGGRWAPGWASTTGIAENFEVSALQLAEWFYQERLLCALLP